MQFLYHDFVFATPDYSLFFEVGSTETENEINAKIKSNLYIYPKTDRHLFCFATFIMTNAM